jgi:hypothetical protein
MRISILSLMVMLGFLVWIGPGAAGSIYDPPIEQRLTLTPEQRPHVRRILAESRSQFQAVFHAYGIDPNGPPVFHQLIRASSELRALARHQRREMRRVLRPDQFAEYDQIMRETRRRIISAAQ